MAVPVLSPVSTGSSRSLASSKRSSYSSWGSRRPRDSLEQMRQRGGSLLAQSPHAHQHRILRNISIQVVPEDQEEEWESGIENSGPLEVPCRPPIHRGVLCDRHPRGKASLLVFVVNVIGMYTFAAAITGILNIFVSQSDRPISDEIQFLNIFLRYCASTMFYPLAGFIADVYVGRYRMIQFSIILLWIGYAIITVSFVLEDLQHDMIKDNIDDIVVYVLRGVAFLLISAGGGGFEATIIPFGVDQLQGASSAEISSYFHFLYFGRNLGMVCGIFVYCVVSYVTEQLTVPASSKMQKYEVFQPLIIMVILTVGILLNICLNHWYFKDRQRENPVKLVLKVLWYAAFVKRGIPVHRRAFRYGEEKKPRIELAKIEYDGKFSAESVEDVKAFCRICFIMIALAPALSSVIAVSFLLPTH